MLYFSFFKFTFIFDIRGFWIDERENGFYGQKIIKI